MRKVASWDGASWQPLGEGLQSLVLALATYCPDPRGEKPTVLVVGGLFQRAGGKPAAGIAQWDGNDWTALPGIASGVFEIEVWDSDGDGEALPQLYAFGAFDVVAPNAPRFRGAARWDGAQWHPLREGFVGISLQRGPRAATGWDSDGSGPIPPQLAVVGDYFGTVETADQTSIPNRVGSLALWDNSRWSPVGNGLTGTINDLLALDRDTSDQDGPELFACGTFTRSRDAIFNGIARWDGNAWQPLAAGLSVYRMQELLSWDPDGTGPMHCELVAGGGFRVAADGGQWLNGVARWDGMGWQPFGLGVIGDASPPGNAAVNALLAWDHDADGATPDRIVAAGDFRFPSPAGFTVNSIAFWDGVAWQPFGDATAQFSGADDDVRDLALFDPDAEGPLAPQVVAVGRFASSAGTMLNGVARWDGLAWQPFANGLAAAAIAVATLDPDGPGPLPRELYVGGEFDVVDGLDLNRIARWDGAAWQPLGEGIESSSGSGVFEMAEWDPDGAGPRGPELVVGGFFTAAGGKPTDSIARWDGASWRVFGSGVRGVLFGGFTPGQVYALEVANLDGAPVGEAALYVGGSITNVGGLPASAAAVYRPNALEIFAQPVDREQCNLGEAQFEIVAEGGSGAASYQWRRDGVPLIDDGRINGATTSMLRIAPTIEGDAGEYDCVVEDDCATVTTAAAALSIELALADMDCDCFITVGDIGGFVLALTDPAAYAERYPTCAANLADLNDDGMVSVADIAPFVALLVP
ncbi:MAG: immunoglobulin domain-containing protein [Phycisphaerae bacterium]|nr:immunoglobulin domain-containing protein [Phycisphaerae bacterium]